MGQSQTPKEIVKSILDGDPSGLNAFLSRYGHELAEYVRALTGSDDPQFETIFEEILVDILRQLRALSPRKNGAFRLFIFSAAARTVRKRFAHILSSGASPRSNAVAVRELETRVPPDEKLRAALSDLTAAERELLVLRYRLHFTYAEISDIIMEARVQFEDRLLNARNHFRTRLLGKETSGRETAWT